PEPGTTTLDVHLTAVGDSGVRFEEVRADQPVYDAGNEVELEIEVRNTTTQAIDLVVEADVRDSNGSVVHVLKANAVGLGQNPPNLPLTFPAGSLTEVEMDWVLQRQPAGIYTVLARGVDTSGRVLAEGTTRFTVNAGAALRGGLRPDPPLVHAGSGTPVHITADLTNIGNETIPAGDVELAIVLDSVDPDGPPTTRATARSVLTGTPLATPAGLSRDAAGNLYVADSNPPRVIRIAPDGSTSVYATLPAGTLVGTAVDGAGRVYAANSANKVYAVDTNGSVSSFTISALTAIQGVDAEAGGALLLVGTGAGVSRLVRRSAAGVETILWSNGLHQPLGVVAHAGGYYVTNYGDHTLVRVEGDGRIEPVAGGFSRPKGVAVDAAGNVYVANSGSGTIARVTPARVVTTFASGLDEPTDLRFDAAGTLYVSDTQANVIYAIAADGTRRVVARSLAVQPVALAWDARDRLHVLDVNTLRVQDAAGASVLATGLNGPKDLAIAADGTVYVTNGAANAVTRHVGTTKTTFASGLSSPWGIAVGADGDVYVGESSGHRIAVFAPDGTRRRTIPSPLVDPAQVVATGDAVYVRNTGSVTRLSGGSVATLAAGTTFGSIAPDPVRGGLVGVVNKTISHLAADGTATPLATAAFTVTDAVVDANGALLASDRANLRVHRFAGGAWSVLATLPSQPDVMVATPAGRVFVKLATAKIVEVAADGTVRQLATPAGESLERLGVAQDGALLVSTSTTRRVYRLDPDSGATTLLVGDVRPDGLATDAGGRLQLAFRMRHELVGYATDGAAAERLVGFFGPRDIVRADGGIRFVDSTGRLFTLDAAFRPVALGTFEVEYLAWSGGTLLGTGSEELLRWSETGTSVVASLDGTLKGLAVRGDGRIGVADGTASRIYVVGADGRVETVLGGIHAPQGLSLASDGALYVANYTAGTVARLDTASGVATVFARVPGPRYIDFD
ncbi:MAG TPA: hypothetical protein VFO79_14655, partial [Xanthomonadales bacterium]|nr:hypothetical protein [Xanthomonadales bacterium]